MQFYNHTQSVASSTWTINHNLGKIVTVSDVWVMHAGALTKILPYDVTHVSNNQLVITFTSAMTGGCRLVSETINQGNPTFGA